MAFASIRSDFVDGTESEQHYRLLRAVQQRSIYLHFFRVLCVCVSVSYWKPLYYELLTVSHVNLLWLEMLKTVYSVKCTFFRFVCKRIFKKKKKIENIIQTKPKNVRVFKYKQNDECTNEKKTTKTTEEFIQQIANYPEMFVTAKRNKTPN